ncbi:glutathione binding-like protein [Sphingomonas solaris]|uniref:Glutathione transferase GstA n=1 Tax=Alterirhizorhabdus solaris TaxID=2529389 RepID=A0A558RBM9_9SPHN|nr:glutathione binding-like protein [Sphingomonas solaris]TVV76857.1 glutathione transferase GstA [Sphingomonas solaris]
MKLYYAPGACSLATHIALNAGDLPHTLEKVDLKAKTTENGADFSAINPKGYVPALELDDGAILTENIAVLSYVGSLMPALFPAEGMARWRTLETLAFISTELHKSFKPLFNPAASEAEKDEAKQTLGKRFALMEQQLGGRDFLIGDGLTVADCYLFVTLFWAREKFGLDLPAGLATYYAALRDHPAVAKALAEEKLG